VTLSIKEHGTTGKSSGAWNSTSCNTAWKQASKDSFIETMASFLNPGLKLQKPGTKRTDKQSVTRHSPDYTINNSIIVNKEFDSMESTLAEKLN
jgi:hypothetical protein